MSHTYRVEQTEAAMSFSFGIKLPEPLESGSFTLTYKELRPSVVEETIECLAEANPDDPRLVNLKMLWDELTRD
jgi:hypothetical protein